MKTRKFVYLVCLLFGINFQLHSQTTATNFEDEYMKCYEKAFKDNGAAILGFLEKSEQFLVDRNVLKDISGKSYLHFLNNSRSYIDTPYEQFYFINFMMRQLQEKNFTLDTFKECSTALKAIEGYENSKMFQVEETLLQIKTVKDVQDITSKVANMLTENELMHPYYRLRIINFLESHGKRSTKEVSAKATLSETELKNALKIHVKAQDEILLNNTSVSFGELLTETKKYLKQHTAKSKIVFKTEKNITPQFSAALKKEIEKIIQQLREQKSQKTYKSSFEKLTKTQQETIKKTYGDDILYDESE